MEDVIEKLVQYAGNRVQSYRGCCDLKEDAKTLSANEERAVLEVKRLLKIKTKQATVKKILGLYNQK